MDREEYKKLTKMLDLKTEQYIEEETLEFIKVNLNHLPMYYIPNSEFK